MKTCPLFKETALIRYAAPWAGASPSDEAARETSWRACHASRPRKLSVESYMMRTWGSQGIWLAGSQFPDCHDYHVAYDSAAVVLPSARVDQKMPNPENRQPPHAFIHQIGRLESCKAA